MNRINSNSIQGSSQTENVINRKDHSGARQGGGGWCRKQKFRNSYPAFTGPPTDAHGRLFAW